MTSLHDKVVSTLYELCRGYKPYSKVYADHVNVPYKVIQIHSQELRRVAAVYKFQPDVWARYKRGGVDVFEVWDSQTPSDCTEDILFSALTPGIQYLSIVCLGRGQYELAKILSAVILTTLHDEEGKSLLDNRNVLISRIPEEIKSDPQKIKLQLKKDFEF